MAGESGGRLRAKVIRNPCDAARPVSRLSFKFIGDRNWAVFAEVLDLRFDQEFTELAKAASSQPLAGKVPLLSGVAESGIELFAPDFNSGGSISVGESVEPMAARTVESTAEVK
jgi:hypothetical protein